MVISTVSPAWIGAGSIMSIMWFCPGASSAVPPAAMTSPPSICCMTISPSLSTTSWISIIPAEGLVAETIVISLSPLLVRTPNAPVISVSVALTHGSATVMGQATACPPAASVAASAPSESEAQADSKPTMRTAAAMAAR